MKDFKYKINGTQYKVEIIRENDDNTVELEVNGTPYTVEIDRPKKSVPKIKRPVAAPTTPSGAPVVKQVKTSSPNAVSSPLPGVIIDVKVKEGQAVKAGDLVMVLEAMKMENSILADKDGVVKEIKVSKGESVLEGADLIVIE